MKITQIMKGLYILPGLVNVYLMETVDGYAIIDSGFPNSAAKILEGIAAVGSRQLLCITSYSRMAIQTTSEVPLL